MKHSLSLTDRGTNHRHRWLPTCRCGHQFIPLRDRHRAEEAYHQHVRKADAEAARGTRVRYVRVKGGKRPRRTGQAGPRAVTPHDQLPPELQ